MGDTYVREVGRIVENHGMYVKVGVDYDAVTIQVGGVKATLCRDRADEFGHAFIAACWEAGANERCLREEANEAGDGESMAYCGQVDGIYECTETGPHAVHLARDTYSKIVHAWDVRPAIRTPTVGGTEEEGFTDG